MNWNGLKTPRFLLWLAGLAWLAMSAHYVVDSRPPLVFYGDLGADVIVIGQLGAFANSLHNLADMIGWQARGDFPSFIYAPMGEYVLALPFEWVLRDPFRTVKLMQVLQISVAFFGMAWLYTSLFGKSSWRWLAAFVYAAAPMTTLLVSGNLGFGWAAVLLAPACALNLALVRRFGALATPAVGLICALATSAFAIEEGLVVGTGLLVLTLALSYWKGFKFPWGAWIAAFAAFALFPAYTIFATFFGHQVVTWIAQPGPDSGLREAFSQRVADQAALALHESMLSGDPEFNFSRGIGFAVAGGAAAWLLALAAFAFALRSANWRRLWPLPAIAAFCCVLAFGPRIPLLGTFLWFVIDRLPVIHSVRTPDRFAQIDALMVALAAAYGAHRLWQHADLRRIAAAAGASLIFCAYVAYTVIARPLGFGALDVHLPSFAPVNATTAAIGGRTAILAFPRRGSLFDYPPYAPEAARLFITDWDLAERFNAQDGGAALMRRTGVGSIVTSPVWTFNSEPNMPWDMQIPFAHSPLVRTASRRPHGMRVLAIVAPRRMLAAANRICTLAGPAAFELAAGERFLDDGVLLHASRTGCTRTLAADYHPLDELAPRDAIASWSGVQVFGKSQSQVPSPYPYVVQRFAINVPWYRNAYAGDTLLSNDPYVAYGDAQSLPLSYRVSKAGSYALYARTAGIGSFVVRSARGIQTTASSWRAQGFSWTILPLGYRKPGTYDLNFTLFRHSRGAMPMVVDEVAVASSGLNPSLHADAVMMSLRSFAPPPEGASRTPAALFPVPQAGPISAKGQGLVLGPHETVGIFNGQPLVRTGSKIARIRSYWDGPTGNYLIHAAAWINGAAPEMDVTSAGQRLQLRYDPSTGVAESLLFGAMHLRRGDPVDVTFYSPQGVAAALAQLEAVPLSSLERPTSFDATGEAWQFDAADPTAFVEALHAPSAWIAAGGSAHARSGTVGTIPFQPDTNGGMVSADLATANSGHFELRCGDQVDSLDSTTGSGVEHLAVRQPGNAPCALRIAWAGPDLTIQSVALHVTLTTLRNWSARQYFPSGTYRWEDDSRGIALQLDGTPWAPGSPRELRAGTHVVTLARAPSQMPPLRFLREGAWPLRAAPAATVADVSSTNWNVGVAVPSTLELSQLDDGNWFARAASSRVAGYPCDLVNTCFDVPAGNGIRVGHTVPKALSLGLTITLLDVLAALIALGVAARRRPSRPA
jgi:hypothetical protein